MKKLFLLIAVLLVSFSLFSCEQEEKEIEIVADQTFSIHTELQKEYLASAYDYISLYANGKEELSRPVPVDLTWEDKNVDEYTFMLSEFSDFSKCEISEKVSINSISIYNLKIHTLYYWCVEYKINDSLERTDTKTLVIENSIPRNLYVDGLTNVRDLGGYRLGVNKYVKQGMIYRCSRLNENETTTNLITEDGINEMVNHLGIKSELDIRRTSNNENGGITSSPLGDSVNYFSVPMESGGNLFLLNKDVIKDAFAVLGNETNYPIVIHCSIGTDRTGMLCFLINALLGVSKEDLYRDFLFSNFGNIGGSRTSSIVDKYISTIEEMNGKTFAEKTYNYLLSLNVEESDLKTIIKIMK